MTGCSDNSQPLVATLTFKRDGSHFSGTVVRRDAKTITVTSPAGDTHTFLYNELSDIQYGSPDSKTNPSGGAKQAEAAGSAPAASPSSSQAKPPAAGDTTAAVTIGSTVQFAAGTVFPVRSFGFIDSCCAPVGYISTGSIDTDVKGADGKVLIPQGATVSLVVREEKIEQNGVRLQFELGTADFNGRHYVISSAKSSLDPGAVVTFQGAKIGSPEAKVRGLNVHIDDNAFMAFKADTPTVMTLSQ